MQIKKVQIHLNLIAEEPPSPTCTHAHIHTHTRKHVYAQNSQEEKTQPADVEQLFLPFPSIVTFVSSVLEIVFPPLTGRIPRALGIVGAPKRAQL